MKSLPKYFLLVFVLGALGVWAAKRFSPEPEAVVQASVSAPVEQSGIQVTYFTTDVRCISCKTIEQLTLASVERLQQNPDLTGRVYFQTLNLDRPENRHFIEEYELSFKTVVVSHTDSDDVTHWIKLDDVWKNLQNPDAFHDLIETEVLDQAAALP